MYVQLKTWQLNHVHTCRCKKTLLFLHLGAMNVERGTMSGRPSWATRIPRHQSIAGNDQCRRCSSKGSGTNTPNGILDVKIIIAYNDDI